METQKLSIWEKRKLKEEAQRKEAYKKELMEKYPCIEKEVWGMPDFIWQSALLIAGDKYNELNAYLQFYINFDPYTGWKTKEGEIQWLLGEAEKAPDWIKNKVIAQLKAL